MWAGSIRSELVTSLSQCLAFSIKITLVFFTHFKTISQFFVVQGHQEVASKAFNIWQVNMSKIIRFEDSQISHDFLLLCPPPPACLSRPAEIWTI